MARLRITVLIGKWCAYISYIRFLILFKPVAEQHVRALILKSADVATRHPCAWAGLAALVLADSMVGPAISDRVDCDAGNDQGVGRGRAAIAGQVGE
jgi:hypothetical protein